MALSLSAVSVGVYAALNVAGLTALVGSRIYDELPAAPTYPCVAYQVEKDEARGLGTRALDEITLRVSTLSTYADGSEGQAIVAKVEDLLKDVSLTISGHVVAGLTFWRRSVRLPDQEINGVKVHEWVSEFAIYVEAA